MIDNNILSNIDWDFKTAKTNSAMHAIHPYPAKFIPQIPNVFIHEFSKVGDTVYDPFLGSGTTCLEANLLGRNAIGNDVNEMSVLITEVKTNPIHITKLSKIDSLLNQVYQKIEDKNTIYEVPPIIHLDLWFKDFVIRELCILKKEILNLEDAHLKAFCLVAMSAIIVNVSKQDSDTRYVRVEKNIQLKDVFIRFSKQVQKMRKMMIQHYAAIGNGTTIVKCADSRNADIFEANSADLAITSPPYPNAYDYHLYHKYRLWWLDMNPNDLKKNEIGAHTHYSKKNGLNEFDFQRDMKKCFENVSTILKPNAMFALVVGDSILNGRKIANHELLKTMSKETPLHFTMEFVRTMNDQKKSFNPKMGNIKQEQILIFKNLK